MNRSKSLRVTAVLIAITLMWMIFLPFFGEGGSSGINIPSRGCTRLRDTADQSIQYRPIDTYLSYNEMMTDMEAFAQSNQSICKSEVIATSCEGRNVTALKISANPLQEEEEPAALIMGCHHGNEGVSAMVPYYLARLLLDNYGSNRTVTALVDENEIWIVPMVNPDGYVHGTRKNRRPNGDGSYGVDLNRNYWYHWGSGPSSSMSPSSYNYIGPYPFSEPETRAIRDLAEEQDFVLSASYHSYHPEGLFLHPWGYDFSQKTEDHELMEVISKRMGNRLGYLWGQSSDPSIGMYEANGDSDDWLYGNLSSLAFTIEIEHSSYNPPPGMLYGICTSHSDALIYFLDLGSNPVEAVASGVRGRVVNSTGHSLGDVNVTLYNDKETYYATTDLAGNYEIKAFSGEYSLLFFKDDYAQTVSQVTVTFDRMNWINQTMTRYFPGNDFELKAKALLLEQNGAAVDEGKVYQSSDLCITVTVSPNWTNLTVSCDVYDLDDASSMKKSTSLSYGPTGFTGHMDMTDLPPSDYGMEVGLETKDGKWTDPNGTHQGYDAEFELIDDLPPEIIGLWIDFEGCQEGCDTDADMVLVVVRTGEAVEGIYITVLNSSNMAYVEAQTMEIRSNGSYSYYWNISSVAADVYRVGVEASDAHGNTARAGFFTGEYDYVLNISDVHNEGCTRNSPPELLNPSLQPRKGDLDTEFSFSITYKDPDGDEPEFIYVWIDGNTYEMYPVSGDAKNGAIYRYEAVLPEGEHRYWFSASDGNQTHTTSKKSGPEVIGYGEGEDNGTGNTLDSDLLGKLVAVLLLVLVIGAIFFIKVRRGSL